MLDIILCIVYAIPLGTRAPDLRVIFEAFDCLEKYGIRAPDKTSDIWSVMVKQAEGHPNAIRAFAIAASHGMDAVCVQISPSTLSQSLRLISEEDATLMGPLYLRRLLRFHMQRQATLKSAIEVPPARHPPTAECSEAHQLDVRQRWELVCTDVVVQPAPQALSAHELRDRFGDVARDATCGQCIHNIQKRVQEVVEAWQSGELTME